MAYLTENQLSNTIDVPIALPTTHLVMGTWLTVGTILLTTPMRLTYSYANLQILSSTVDTTLITSGNKVYGSLGLVYIALRQNYTGGTPGAPGALDTLIAPTVGSYRRSMASNIVLTSAGVYSWIICSNMKASTDASPLIPPSTSIDFRVAVSGSVRMELSGT